MPPALLRRFMISAWNRFACGGAMRPAFISLVTSVSIHASTCGPFLNPFGSPGCLFKYSSSSLLSRLRSRSISHARGLVSFAPKSMYVRWWNAWPKRSSVRALARSYCMKLTHRNARLVSAPLQPLAAPRQAVYLPYACWLKKESVNTSRLVR